MLGSLKGPGLFHHADPNIAGPLRPLPNDFEKLHERLFRNVDILFEPSAKTECSDMRCRCTAVE
jgi:hypothetical protein